MSFLERWADEQGYDFAIAMGDGVAAITQTLTGQGVIIVGDLGGVRERYTFSSPGRATIELGVWAGRQFYGEPEGWHRHQPSGRRRPDGDPAREYVLD